MSGAVEVADGADAAASPGRAWLTVALCSLASIAEGFDIQSMGVAAPGMAPALHLTRAQLGPAFSASTVGLFIGAFLVGALADRVGRKWTLVGSLAVFGALTLTTPYAPDLTTLLVIRLAAGLGLGGAMPNFITLAAESVSESRRAQFVAISAAAMPLGGAVASAVAAVLPWRAIFVVGGVWPLALAALMAAALPESARFLGARAKAVSPREALFGGGRGIASLLLWAAAFCVLLSLYLLLNWLPLLLSARGLGKADAALVQLLFNVGAAVGTLGLALLFRGRRRAGAMAAWFVGMAAGALLLALAPPTIALSGAAGFVAGWFISSAPTALYALASDFYAVEIRGTGLGSVIGFGRLGAIIGPLLAGALLAHGKDASGVLMALPPFIVAGALATFLALPRRPAHTR
jgi:MFS transporter, AAHS family, 3-hydroxyphenylpropionic acid transporter